MRDDERKTPEFASEELFPWSDWRRAVIDFAVTFVLASIFFGLTFYMVPSDDFSWQGMAVMVAFVSIVNASLRFRRRRWVRVKRLYKRQKALSSKGT